MEITPHPPARIRTKKKVRRGYPTPPQGPTPPPILPFRVTSKKVFFGAFGANVLCVPHGHVQGVSQLFTLNGISMKRDCHEYFGLILSYCGHRFCHKFIALSLPCIVTLVVKEEGQSSMGFCYAKKFSGAFGAECVWEFCWQGGGSTPHSQTPHPPLSSAPILHCPPPPLGRGPPADN